MNKYIILVTKNGVSDQYYMPGKDEKDAKDNLELIMDGKSYQVMDIEEIR